MGLDIGPASITLFSEALQTAAPSSGTAPWGSSSSRAFASGTMAMAKSVASSSGLTIVGGGDTDSALHKAGLTDKVRFHLHGRRSLP